MVDDLKKRNAEPKIGIGNAGRDIVFSRPINLTLGA